MNAWCCMNQTEREQVEAAIIVQRVAASTKMSKCVEDAKMVHRERGKSVPLKLKKVRMDMMGGVKWKRKVMDSKQARADEKETRVITGEGVAKYTTRILECPQCGNGKETAKMQLRLLQGLRDIHCKVCKHHARCGWYKCSCQVVWHHCTLHRVDPTKHTSTRHSKDAMAKRKCLQTPI